MKYVIVILNSYNIEKMLFFVLFCLLIGYMVNSQLKNKFHIEWNSMPVYDIKDLDHVINQYVLHIMAKKYFRSTVCKIGVNLAADAIYIKAQDSDRHIKQLFI